MSQVSSILAFVLLWINLMVSSINIYFSIKVLKSDVYSVNLRGTKERLLEINPNYFLEKEIEKPNELRYLSYDKLRLSIVIINACSFLFILMFAFSFCIDEDECCSNEGICICGCCVCCAGSHCSSCDGGLDCSNVDGEAGLGICLLILVAFILVGLFYAAKACGKLIARMFSIIALLLMNAILVALSLCSGFDKFCILVAAFSSFAALCNIIMIIIVICFACGCNISKKDYYPPVQQAQQLQVVQPQYEKPHFEETYPNSKEVTQETYGKPVTPNYNAQNQGNNYNYENPTAYDAPSPEYQQQNTDNNNQRTFT